MIRNSATLDDQNWKRNLTIGGHCDIFDSYGLCYRGIIINIQPTELTVFYLDWSFNYAETVPLSSNRVHPPNKHLIPFESQKLPTMQRIPKREQCNYFYNKENNNVIISTHSHIIYYNIKEAFEHRVKTIHLTSSFKGNLNLTKSYPILNEKTNKLWFIECASKKTKDTKYPKIYKPTGNVCKNGYFEQENKSLIRCKAFLTDYHKDNYYAFMANEDRHILYGDHSTKSNTIKHIKYDENQNIFIKMQDIKGIKKQKFERCRFRYNECQDRLYMTDITIQAKKTLIVNISSIEGMYIY